MKLNAVNCGTSEIREYAVDSYSCQINQPSKTLPSAITKQHHLRCLYTCQLRNFRYTTETENWNQVLGWSVSVWWRKKLS